MILSSRSETFSSFWPSIENFFYGHGTWTPLSEDIAGPHSHIMQAFFEYGFFASFFLDLYHTNYYLFKLA